MEVFIDQRPVVDEDDIAGKSDALTANTSDSAWVDVVTLRTRTGRLARLSQVANAVDPGAESFMRFRLLVNGNPISDPLYSNFGAPNIGAVGTTYEPGQRMTSPRALPQGAYVQLQAMLQATAAATTYRAYGRVKVEYLEF